MKNIDIEKMGLVRSKTDSAAVSFGLFKSLKAPFLIYAALELG